MLLIMNGIPVPGLGFVVLCVTEHSLFTDSIGAQDKRQFGN